MNVLAYSFVNASLVLLISISTVLSPSLAQSPNLSKDAQNYLKIGRDLNAKEDYQRALEAFNQVIRLQPNRFEGYYYRGVTYSLVENDKAALDDVERAIALNPNDALSYSLRGLLLFRYKRQFQPALRDLDRSIQLDKSQSASYGVRGTIRREMKDFAGALSDFREGSRLAQASNQQSLYQAYLRDIQQTEALLASSATPQPAKSPNSSIDRNLCAVRVSKDGIRWLPPAILTPEGNPRIIPYQLFSFNDIPWGMSYEEFKEKFGDRIKNCASKVNEGGQLFISTINAVHLNPKGEAIGAVTFLFWETDKKQRVLGEISVRSDNAAWLKALPTAFGPPDIANYGSSCIRVYVSTGNCAQSVTDTSILVSAEWNVARTSVRTPGGYLTFTDLAKRREIDRLKTCNRQLFITTCTPLKNIKRPGQR